MSTSRDKLDALRKEALAAARGLSSGESALAGVLRDLERERSRAAQGYHAVVRSLAAALEARDGYTGEHCDDVQHLAVGVARRLGLGDDGIGEVEAVALLHDVGKIGIPDQILHKPGPLTEAEWELMREHPVIGERILRPLPGLSAVATAVRHEHERWDGEGYPDGRAGEDIPLASRIVLACDAYHALVSERPYRAAMTHERAVSELERNAGTQFDPRVVAALTACLAEPEALPSGLAGPDDMARILSEPEQDAGGARLERELHALIAIAGVVGAAHRLEDVVEVIAEQSCEAIGAASLSISRFEAEGRLVRTLVNAGELGPGEERTPADETYPLEGDELLRNLIDDGSSYRMSVDDEDADPVETRLLLDLGKHHSIGVLINLAGKPWGEIWAARTAAEEPFTDRDIRFLTTVSGQIAAAAGRAEVFARMSDLAFRDPLTGVGNRRALDERLEAAVQEAVDRGSDVTVVLCDMDNLKELNDAHGHQAGDGALVRVASSLSDLAGESALVARIGGDEFCVLLEGTDAAVGRALAEQVLERLASGDGPAVTVSCGVASIGLGSRRPGDLMRAADAAQYTAKRSGRARVCVANAGLEGALRAGRGERRAMRGRAPACTVDVAALLSEGMAELDGPYAARPPLDRLEVVAMAVGDAIDASASAVSWRDPAGSTIETLFTLDRRTGQVVGSRYGIPGEDFDACEYATSARLMASGGSVTVRIDDPEADPAERALLDAYGMAGLLAVGVPDAASGQWLVELFSDPGTGPLEDIEHALRLMAGEAVRGAVRRDSVRSAA